VPSAPVSLPSTPAVSSPHPPQSRTNLETTWQTAYVETPEQHSNLRALRRKQGFFYNRPFPGDAATSWLHAQRSAVGRAQRARSAFGRFRRSPARLGVRVRRPAYAGDRTGARERGREYHAARGSVEEPMVRRHDDAQQHG